MTQKNSKKGWRKGFSQYDVVQQYEIQQGLCNWERCPDISGKNPPPLGITYEKDHIMPLDIHKLLGQKWDPHVRKNISLQHDPCHKDKTRQDEKLSTFLRRNNGDKKIMQKARGCIRRHNDNMWKARKCLLQLDDDN